MILILSSVFLLLFFLFVVIYTIFSYNFYNNRGVSQSTLYGIHLYHNKDVFLSNIYCILDLIFSNTCNILLCNLIGIVYHSSPFFTYRIRDADK